MLLSLKMKGFEIAVRNVNENSPTTGRDAGRPAEEETSDDSNADMNELNTTLPVQVGEGDTEHDLAYSTEEAEEVLVLEDNAIILKQTIHM